MSFPEAPLSAGVTGRFAQPADAHGLFSAGGGLPGDRVFPGWGPAPGRSLRGRLHGGSGGLGGLKSTGSYTVRFSLPCFFPSLLRLISNSLGSSSHVDQAAVYSTIEQYNHPPTLSQSLVTLLLHASPTPPQSLSQLFSSGAMSPVGSEQEFEGGRSPSLLQVRWLSVHDPNSLIISYIFRPKSYAHLLFFSAWCASYMAMA